MSQLTIGAYYRLFGHRVRYLGFDGQLYRFTGGLSIAKTKNN
jgi:hypothetical protein